ncbi:phosphorybosylanthranilate isomerase [bacterium]|nr:phosphorybosylanthranilate isomerase [bacterium]
MTRFPLFGQHPFLIGVIHLPALPGAPRSSGKLTEARKIMRRDLQALRNGGVHGIILENFGDTPFSAGSAAPSTLASLTALAVEARQLFPGPLGINLLRNDGIGAMAIAHAVGADFIRVNVLVGARVADQGVLNGIAETLLRFRREIGADKIKILADVDVKHSAPLAPGYTIEDEARDAWERGGADALILSGCGTGHGTDPEHLRRAHAAAPRAPLLVGSGATLENLADFLPETSGFIVGTALKKDGKIHTSRVRSFVRALSQANR